jgi:hypothetical protein
VRAAFEVLVGERQGSKLDALLAALRRMRAADPAAKAVVFSQFRQTHVRVVEALKVRKAPSWPRSWANCILL